ncbi:MAG: M20 family metallo-hydrolase [Bacteroides sp.]|nr:M20 family metallo-hydrolase [Prevotella sp.]MCM1408595.1 M20 family metallo-hydrolase [Treponema brennaborense]MCM1468917.1 M20 family metallo-hydrolase [Bacteroides sp.]
MTDFEKITAYIERSRNEMIELQKLLTPCKALSPENGGQGEYEKCEVLEKWLRENGISCLKRFDAPDSRVGCGFRPNLAATVRGKDDSCALWIITHLDVVPAGARELWHTDPWTITEKDGRLYGRGSEDNQQGLVCGIFALLALIKNGITPAHTVNLLFAADEETGSKYGIQYLLREHALFGKNDLVVVPDGGDPEGKTIEVAEKNVFWVKVCVGGKQAHGSRPDEGANAFLAGCDLALRIHDLEKTFSARDALFQPDYSTFQPTKKEANVPNVNTIPGQDVFYVDCRILPCYTLDQVRAAMNECAADIEKKYGVTVDFSELQAVESPATPPDAPIVKKLADAVHQVRGIEAEIIGIGGGTVAAELRNHGINAAVWSTIDETAHQPDESCSVRNMLCDAKILASLMI